MATETQRTSDFDRRKTADVRTSHVRHQTVTIDGNEAAAYVAHKANEIIAIYPITPSSAMGEWSDAWSADGRSNLWGTVPSVNPWDL